MLGYPYGWLIGTGLFLLLLCILAMSPVVISGHVKRIDNDDHAELRIRALFGVVHYHWKLPVARLKGMSLELRKELTAENAGGSKQASSTMKYDSHSVMKSIDSTYTLLRKTDDLFGWVRRTLSHIRLTEWQWRTRVGTGDAMWTAMLTGMLWSVKTTSIGVLSQLVRLLADPKIAVEPNYARASFSTEGRFTAKINFAYMFYAGIHLLYQIKKSKGIPKGLQAWQRILLRG